jgi:ribosomal protein S8
MFNNLVANLISNLRITVQHKRSRGCGHYSKFCLNILNKLAERQIVQNITIEEVNKRKMIKFNMPHYNQTYFFNKIFCCYKVSMYGHVKYIQLKKIIEQYEEGIVSTNKGLMFVQECLKRKIGGKLILLYR